MSNDVLFEIKDLEVSYGSIAAIKGISLEVHKGEIVTILGANGAGKTTTMRTISQLLEAKPPQGFCPAGVFSWRSLSARSKNKSR